MNNFSKLLFAVLLVPALSIAGMPTWKIDNAKSKLTFTATQNGSPTTGEFKTFNGNIQFDPAQLAASSIVIDVDVGSVTTSYKDISDTLKTSGWFDASAFPKATFKSDKVVNTGGKNYEATGTLTIKGISVPVKLTFVLNEYSADHAQATGETTLQRTAFKVGTGEWEKTDTVKDSVKVNFVLVTTK